MKSKLIQEFNLPGYVKGKTFAEASKAIDAKFKDRVDPHSEATKKELLERLSQAQEYLKMKEDAKNGVMQPGMGEQPMPGQNQMFTGGRVPVQSVNELTPQGVQMANPLDGVVAGDTSKLTAPGVSDGMGAGIGGATGMVGDAATLLEFGKTAFGDTGIDTTGNAGRQAQAKGAGWGAAQAGLKGASVGAKYGGPWGAAIGAAVGAGSSLLGASKQRKDIAEGNMNASLIENNKFSNDFAGGGKIPDPTKPLNKKDVASINQSTGVEFDQTGANALFARVPGSGGGANDLDFGKYGKVGYFQMGNMTDDTYRISNTDKNPHNRGTIDSLVDDIRKLNPGKKIELDYTNQFSEGGKLPKNPFADINLDVNTPQLGTSGLIPSLSQNAVEKPKWSMNHDSTTYGTKSPYQMGPTETTFKGQSIPDPKERTIPKANLGWLKDNAGSILNAAPIAMNALQLAQLEKADGFRYDRLDGRYKENQIDERALENKVQNESTNAINALGAASNGSAGALRSGILGSQLQKTNALSDAYLKANQMNSEDKRFGQQFNAQQDALNQRASMLETNERRADDAAYGTAKSLLMSQLGESIGDFGKQMDYKKMAIQSTDYSWDGKYYVDHNGKKITSAQYKKIKDAEAVAKSKGE